MKRMLVIGILAACGPSRFAGATLPDPPPVSIATVVPARIAGEHLTWDVFWQGMAIGRAELAADPRAVHTTFHTGTLASALASIRYDQTTVFDGPQPRSSREDLTLDGERERVDATFEGARSSIGTRIVIAPGGDPVHTLPSALGVLRTWAQAGAAPGYLWLLHRGQLYRLDVARPTRDTVGTTAALRIDGLVRAYDRSRSLDVTIWLDTTPARVPVRFVVHGGGERIAAELTDAATSF